MKLIGKFYAHKDLLINISDEKIEYLTTKIDGQQCSSNVDQFLDIGSNPTSKSTSIYQQLPQ